ncbi:CHAT domain-containing protein [Streptomyces sp. NPDC047082]|uniref:CHAT domain-containing protein n=1 Tax=Streptomyces sp. NPDC047082 TaxID=3155259 RepID=UPI0033CF5FC1
MLTGFVTDVGRKLAERWAGAVVLPGLLFTCALATGVTLRQGNWYDMELLRHPLTELSSGAGSTRTAVLLLGALAASFAAGLLADALSGPYERVLLGSWPWPLGGAADALTGRRRRIWRERDEACRRAREEGEDAVRVGGLEVRRNQVALVPPECPTWTGDRLRASYTPTLRALLFSRARRRAAPGRRSTLAVAMPETAGQAPLARTVAEAAEAVAAGGGVPLIGAAATRDAVRTAVPVASLVHFACHADSDPEQPAAGRLLLADGDLFLQDIAELRLESAELAYLSACGTARGSTAPALVDEAIHLASAFQLAGYAQSVATLWEIGDAFAADAAARFHRTLAPALPHPGPLPAAQALHHTVRSLRTERPDLPWTWAALVHAGA